MKPEMKMITSLLLYILTSLFLFECVSALPSVANRDHDGILQRVLKQDSGNLPSVSEQEPGIRPSAPEQDPGIRPSAPEQDPGILENIEETLGEPCPNGWTPFDNYCYLESTSIKTWDHAQEYCESLGAGLVKINNPEENEFVLNLITKKAPSLKHVWIGLKWSTNNFYWYDHSVPVYTNWAKNEPNGKAKEPCGQMWMNGHSDSLPIRAAGTWNDIRCEVTSSFPNGIVCERLP